jgi:hypothetical protein
MVFCAVTRKQRRSGQKRTQKRKRLQFLAHHGDTVLLA